ncbi:phytanoyl-CoA dioxygenase family protein [Paenibacillus cremeus]|uniref:Phytanoyl-CoA dioxygenase family protein n=1 Tax=Paenibacillus cremeus TaxID=2163881 RepID=A0A559K5U3_9BACL|nr:phytanoyl-CoA dioxygenase family protein [Paenibacillus cremeus]TVY07511.1 phytanoyl-CoA dioxygenase family protein [Paenibacillus cremeus]
MSEKGHRISYEILNMKPDEPKREIEVLATQEELTHLIKQGYLIKEDLFSGTGLEELRSALDRLEAKEKDDVGVNTMGNFGGLFLRYLMDKDETFLKFLQFQPLLSIARAMLGPQVQMGMSARISYPGPENQETIWHQHLRYIPKPLPPWFIRPHCLDVLLYLDDVTDANGPLCVVPGSHERIQEEPPAEYFGEMQGSIVLRPKAGTAVLQHANLWHRAMPTTSEGSKRRLLILSYYPTWLKRGLYGVQPADGLTKPLEKQDNEEILELLGKTGYM